MVLSLSGFANPERQRLRDQAISMGFKSLISYNSVIGAKWKNDLYDGVTTHLVCKAQNDGKYRNVPVTNSCFFRSNIGTKI